MRKTRPELAVRAISAIILAVAVLGLTIAGGIAFKLLCLAAAGTVLYEYSRLSAASARKVAQLAAALSLAAMLAAMLLAGPGLALGVLVASVAAIAAWELANARSAWAAGGLAYAGLPCLALIELRQGAEGLAAILAVFAIVWGADILAYFTGRAIGGPKLAPRISPNKTWSGFFGGLAGSLLLLSTVLAYFGHSPTIAGIVLALAISIVSQGGDLAESWIKRHFGVKDSGRIIPGHGGLLDRIDGLLAAAIAAWIAGVSAGPGDSAPAAGLIAALLG
jgi:phosphatidate cytidylyltransferase